MKKILLIVSILLLTACTSKTEYFTMDCTKKVKSNNVSDNIKREVTYSNKDEVSKIVITRTFKALNDDGINTIKEIKTSSKSFNNDMLSENVHISVITDEDKEYKVKYFLDVSKMNSKEASNLDIKKNSIKYLNYLKKEGMTCERS